MSKKFEAFQRALMRAQTEEEVKHAYAKHFDLEYDTAWRHDLYSPQVLYEFKNQKPLLRTDARAAVVAQVLYYVRRLKFEHADKVVPPMLCVADAKHAFFTETATWRKFFNDPNYDWESAPSQPDRKLVADIANSSAVQKIKVYDILDQQEYELFSSRLKKVREEQLEFDFREKKLITDENFEEVFLYWSKCLGEAVEEETKPSRFFLCDIQEGRSEYNTSENKVVFKLTDHEHRSKKILPKDYEWFWSNYEKVKDRDTIRNIIAKIDRLTQEPIRRFTGEFFTPIRFARKAHGVIERVLGPKWWTKNVRIWDMAAGTGNLEWQLPVDSYDKLYLSTLYQEDADYCSRLFPQATCFKYDYLNDDIDLVFGEGESLGFEEPKMPLKLRRDLADSSLTWLIFINPPFATAQKAGYSGESKKSVSDTRVRPLMHSAGLGEVSRELFAQFLYRIRREFSQRKTHLGLFSTLKYVNANNDQKFRDTVFKFKFEDGFIFSSANFAGTKEQNPFPVGFLMWNLSHQKKLEQQQIKVAVLDDDGSRLGYKLLASEHRDQFLSKWIERPEANNTFPPLGGAITVKEANKDTRDRVADGFIASLMCKGNDVQNHNNVALLSGPYVSAGALSVTPENFEKALLVHAVRRTVRKTWSNDRDQFLKPARPPSRTFVDDCVIWSLFAQSNQTASIRDVEYKGVTYQIKNEFFPFEREVVANWQISDSEIVASLSADREERFVSGWLAQRQLDPLTARVLELGEAIYKVFFAEFKNLRTSHYKIHHWDAGWFQIKRCLADASIKLPEMEELSDARSELADRIRRQTVEHAILTEA